MNQEPNFMRYLNILFHWRRFIIINFLVFSFLITGVCFLLPNWYKATASLLPPKQPDIFGSLGASGSLLKGISGLGKLGSLGQKSGSYNYFAILHSRATMEAVIKKFDLIHVYDISDESIEKTIKALDGNVAFEEQTDDNITIEVYDKDPVRAANMANYFIEVLNEVNTRLGTQEARTNREFIERRLEQCHTDLKKAEDALRDYQEKSGVIIAIDEKNSSVVAYAELYAMKVKKDIEVAVLKKSVSSDDLHLRQLNDEVFELNLKLNAFPDVGLASFRLYREVATQQKILEFILPLYEQARIDEQKDIPVLLVLDKAVPPERKSKPQRSLIIIMVSFLVLTFSIAMTFLMEATVKLNGDGNSLIGRMHVWVQRIIRFYRIRQ